MRGLGCCDRSSQTVIEQFEITSPLRQQARELCRTNAAARCGSAGILPAVLEPHERARSQRDAGATETIVSTDCSSREIKSLPTRFLHADSHASHGRILVNNWLLHRIQNAKVCPLAP